MGSPRSMPEWMRWVETRLRRLDQDTQALTEVPLAGAILWPPGGDPPDGFLVADGSTFDGTDYPELRDELGGTTLPSLGTVAGAHWVIRAD